MTTEWSESTATVGICKETWDVKQNHALRLVTYVYVYMCNIYC